MVQRFVAEVHLELINVSRGVGGVAAASLASDTNLLAADIGTFGPNGVCEASSLAATALSFEGLPVD